MAFLRVMVVVTLAALFPGSGLATPFTTTVPGVGIPLPDVYPEAGGVAIVMVGDNGNIYYQFSDPNGAFVGFQYNGQPAAFRGNPFTINDPIPLDCGVRTCTDYFGGGIATMHVRFSAYDGDTQPGGFDFNDIDLVMNGVTVGNWSSITTQRTNDSGTTSFGSETGFGNNSFNTGWFSTTNQTLLDDILATGQTTTQVRDADPNDNYWDFRRGDSLPDEALRTIAPGYEFEKTADVTDFTAVGQVITYTYTVTNIGSVDITDLTVTDDKVASITCDTTTINQTTGGGAPEVATCTGTYVITQADYDAQQVTNIALANGTPEYGALGAVTDTVTLPGPPVLSPALSVAKTASPTAFSAPGEVITYTYTVENTGDSTLSSVALTDDRIPGTFCQVASLAPGDSTGCSATYSVTQADIDAFVTSGTTLDNIATATATDPNGTSVDATDSESLPGPVAAPTLVLEKTALQADFDAVGDVLQYRFEITNTGNVTWPAAPAIDDPLITGAGGSVTCPGGSVAPGAVVSCTGSYTVTQADLDAGAVDNTATAEISVGGVTETATDSLSVPAVIATGLDIVKRLPAGADSSFDAVGQTISYEYELTNTGTVTLDTPSVSDDKVAVTCPAGSIAPGDSVTCSSDAPYVITQADLDAGGVTNLATGSAQTVGGDTVDSAQTDLTVPADQAPALAMDKTAPNVDPGDFVPGFVVTYNYEVTNTGNVTITDPITVNDDRIAGPIACGAAPLAPGASRSCTADYTVTEADVLAGLVSNRATATDGTTTSNEDTQTVPQSGTPALGLAKAAVPAGVTFSSLTDSVDFEFTVTNTGDTSIIDSQPITIDDPLIGAVDCSAQPSVLAPGDSFVCTATYSAITQAQLDAGEIVNTATAQFTDSSGPVISPQAGTTVPADITPGMSLDKQGPAEFGAVGSTVTFTFDLTNDSAQTIATASISDPAIPGLTCDFNDIAPFGTVSCTGDYTVTQADLDAGQIVNTATATGQAPDGTPLSASDTETVPVDSAAVVPALSLDKQADVASVSAVGEVIDYSFAVTNSGTVTLAPVTVSDPGLGLTCTIPSLAPGAVDSTTCTGSHTVTQGDIDAGEVENTASADAADLPSPATDSVVTPVTGRSPAFTIDKSADDTAQVSAGQVLTYSHVVTNTGNVSLTDITLTDSHTSAGGTTSLVFSPSNVIASLAPGDSVTVTTSYAVTQADIDAGADLTNSVSGSATPPADLTAPNATDDEAVTVADPAPAVSVVKTEQDGSSDFGAVGSSETFTFAVTNDGNVTLSGFALTDDLTGFSCTLPDLAPGATATTCQGGVPLQTVYTITQANVDAGSLTNEVTVTDGVTTGTDAVTLSGPVQAPALSMVKTATAGAGYAAVGDIVSYDYVISNDGNITLSGPFTVADDKTSVTCPAAPAAGLAPGATLTCSAEYSVTQGDLDAGSVTNVATASTTQSLVPGGPTPVSSAPVSETVAAAQGPALTLDKRITPATATTFAAPGDQLSYTFTITNSGNVTIPAPITVDDDRIGTGLACLAAPLAPGASGSCTHSWTATQADVDVGSVTNTAAPVASFGGNPVPATGDSVTALAVQAPELALDKEFVSITNGTFAAAEVITYSYTVTNTGNTTVTTEPVITDNLITDPADLTIDAPFPPAGLPPGGSVTYTGVYTVTLADVQLGSVTNAATADSDGVTSPPDSVTTPIGANPSLSLIKQADLPEVSAVGQMITYTYEVTNTSSGTPAPAFANPITVSDDRIAGPIACDPTADNQLVVGETTTCTATYTVTQTDLDSGEVVNAATAGTEFAGQTVFSPGVTETVPVDAQPSLATLKEVIAGPDPAAAGDELSFRITTTNDGNQTLSNVQIDDPLLPALTCTPSPGPVSLAPGAALVCEGDYTVTQADIDAQSLTNTATASATSPQGVDVSDDGTATPPVAPAAPQVTVLKELPAAAYSAPGEVLTYRVTVTNSGNVTLTSAEVTDSNVAGICAVGELAPGASDSSCTFDYIVTQADIDAGSIDNTADVIAQPTNPGADPVSGDDTLSIDGPAQEPAFGMSKTADLAVFNTAGETITYTYQVGNTGNVTLTQAPSVTDDRIASVSCPPLPSGGLAPGDFITCSATYVTTQADVDAGGVTNVASVGSPEAPFDPQNPGGAEATETVPADRTPAITVDKQADDTTEVVAGQVVTYSYNVENTGNVTLTDITLTDDHTTASGTAPLAISDGGVISTLAPGDSAVLTASYTVTQADIDAGADLSNSVSLTATSPDGSTPTASDSETVTVAPEAPAMEVIKSVAASTGAAAGDSVTFEVTVQNTGNVTLSAPALSDTLRRADGTDILPAPVPVLSAGDGGTLDPGEVWTYEVTHVLA
ncbi:MAG: hypothetical protein GVY31_11695, partial [Alphaproteobacteria bacterium]|nr:hypothetical protein [Alphaproteobacteria bacterium]